MAYDAPASFSASGGTLTGPVADVMALTKVGAGFTAAVVGQQVVISGSTTPANDGTYPVVGNPDSDTIEYTNASGVAETAGTWVVEYPDDWERMRYGIHTETQVTNASLANPLTNFGTYCRQFAPDHYTRSFVYRYRKPSGLYLVDDFVSVRAVLRNDPNNQAWGPALFPNAQTYSAFERLDSYICAYYTSAGLSLTTGFAQETAYRDYGPRYVNAYNSALASPAAGVWFGIRLDLSRYKNGMRATAYVLPTLAKVDAWGGDKDDSRWEKGLDVFYANPSMQDAGGVDRACLILDGVGSYDHPTSAPAFWGYPALMARAVYGYMGCLQVKR